MLLYSASLGLQDKHHAYLYAFGACDVHRREITCPGLFNVMEEVDEYEGLSPWWRITGQNEGKKDGQKYTPQKWQKPRNLNFSLVHNFSKEEPWCTYVLKHNVSVAASTLNLEDLDKFKFSNVTTKHLFSGCEVKDADVMYMKSMEQRVKHHLEQCRSVIPSSLITQKCLKLERDLIINLRSDETVPVLCKQILYEIDNSSNASEKEKLIKLSLQKCITDRNLAFHAWLQELKEVRKLKVDRGIQLNDWFLAGLEDELDQLNFKTSTIIIFLYLANRGQSLPSLKRTEIGLRQE